MLRWLIVVVLLLFGAGCDVAIDIAEPAAAAVAEAEVEPEVVASPASLRVAAPRQPRGACAFVERVLDSATDPDSLFRPPRG